jgi:serine/threonine protein kinase
MTLRRFPWKAPRVSDNSYKLFISPPNDGPKSIMHNSQSSTTLHPESGGDDRRQVGPQSEPASRQASEQSPHHHHHHHHHRRDGVQSDAGGNDKRPASGSAANGENKQQPQVIKGPWRLLRLLPRESRHIIGRMLEIDPKRRATLEEILQDKWVTGSQICSQEEGGRIIRAENHEHTLEPGAGSNSAPPTKQQQK